MAYLRGKGQFNDVPLIVNFPAKGRVSGKDGNEDAIYLEIQVDQSLRNPDKVAKGDVKKGEGIVPIQTNPYLVSYDKPHPDGGTYVAHRDRYWPNQLEKIEKAATASDPKLSKIVKCDNGDVLYGIRANLMQNTRGNLVIDTSKEIKISDNPHFGKNILDKQAAVTKAAKAYRDATRDSKSKAKSGKEAKAAEAQAEAGDELQA